MGCALDTWQSQQEKHIPNMNVFWHDCGISQVRFVIKKVFLLFISRKVSRAFPWIWRKLKYVIPLNWAPLKSVTLLNRAFEKSISGRGLSLMNYPAACGGVVHCPLLALFHCGQIHLLQAPATDVVLMYALPSGRIPGPWSIPGTVYLFVVCFLFMPGIPSGYYFSSPMN